ncbi:MAG TPA: glycosyl hydrolase family 65 protein [Candidatus Dormibacteraeota bacterium]|nr:glycosyl hydrolase family 65 protein [Candidatus Dormibacteraeota bacterium]
MIENEGFPCEPWCVREDHLDLTRLGQTESIFALSNGHIGWRGNFDEGEPHVISGSYLNGVYESVPLPYAETAYGNPEAGQTIVNVTNGKVIRLLVDDEPFDTRYGTVRKHERTLDLREGVLRREVEWESPAHRTVRVRSTRLVSLLHRALAAVEYVVEVVDGESEIVLQSELVANEPPSASEQKADPRAGAAIERPLEPEVNAARGTRAVLIHSTKRSRLRMAVAFDHVLEAPRGARTSVESSIDHARFTVHVRLKPGQRIRLVKFVAYAWSSLRSAPALRSQVDGALAAARGHGWAGIAAGQRRFLREFWDRSDVVIEGDPQVQQAIRFALFHVLQSSARAELRAIPAKGLTGPGYDGHTFWDTEMFVMPVLVYTNPAAAADLLRWRHSILDLARARATQLGLKGAAFPWRTIHGEECSGYWPASTAAFHLNADIADAVLRYVSATGDRAFEYPVGADLLVETARLWVSLGQFDRAGRFRIDGVTGPDEYSAIADNNLYTNLMAQQNLRAAIDSVNGDEASRRRLKVKREEIALWTRAADSMFVPYNDDLGVHEQASDFTRHARWDFEHTAPDQYPLMLHFPYFDLYRKQVIKQADLVLAMQVRSDAFTADEKHRNFAYYEPLTVRDSSLSSCTQSVMAAEVGHLELAYDYLGEAALMDIDDLEHNVRDGLHMGSLAGAWMAAVAGLGGMRHQGSSLSFGPRLPRKITRLRFRMTFLGRLLEVDFNRERATYRLLRGRPLAIKHHGEEVRLTARRPVVRPIPAGREGPEPKQPPGRQPARRRSDHKTVKLRPKR